VTNSVAHGAVSRPRLRWIDCTADAVVGVLVMALSDWPIRLEGLPRVVLLFTGVANCLYASYESLLEQNGGRMVLRAPSYRGRGRSD
jgi:hypothetical protein